MDLRIQIRLLQARDIESIASAFSALGWPKPASQYQRYLSEQEHGQRTVPMAFVDDVFAGYLTVVWRPDYPPFRDENIPEIKDFNVLPQFRRRGIGTRLMDTVEHLVSERSPVVGIGVGMTSDYGTAQRMYVKRGYIPDGRGLMSHSQPVQYGEQVTVGDDLVLYFTKILGP